ncbi:MAG: L-threonylcarbamoyladenylate synthase [Nitrospirota bacterium]
MKILRIDDDLEMVLADAVKVLKSGGIIAYPTETFYALGVDAMDEVALKKLYKLKGRSQKKPLPVIIGDRKRLKTLIKRLPPQAERLIKRFWPGPLTIVFEASSDIPELLTAKTGKIAIRIPGEKIALRMVKKTGFPITSTSANPSGEPPATRPEKVMKYFGDRIVLLIDGGKTPGGKPSTIVDVTGPMKILREGAVSSRVILDLD